MNYLNVLYLNIEKSISYATNSARRTLTNPCLSKTLGQFTYHWRMFWVPHSKILVDIVGAFNTYPTHIHITRPSLIVKRLKAYEMVTLET